MALLFTGCATKTPTTAPAPAQSAGLTPYAIAFWDEQKGLVTGQAGCPVQCGDQPGERNGRVGRLRGSARRGLYVTADGGQSWQWLDHYQRESRDVWDLWMLTDQTGYLLVRDNNEPRQFKLMKTQDGGASVSLVKQWPIDPPH